MDHLELDDIVQGVLQHLSLGCLRKLIGTITTQIFVLMQLFTSVDNKFLGGASPFTIIELGRSDVLEQVHGLDFG